MKTFKKTTALFVFVFSFLCLHQCSNNRYGIEGHWRLLREKSSSIDPWSTLTLDIGLQNDTVVIVKTYSAGNPHDVRKDSIRVNTRGTEQTLPMPSDRWLGEVSMGVYYKPSSFRHVTASWNADGKELGMEVRETLETSQGEIETTTRKTYTVSPDASTLIVAEKRSTRLSGPSMGYEFVRVAK